MNGPTHPCPFCDGSGEDFRGGDCVCESGEVSRFIEVEGLQTSQKELVEAAEALDKICIGDKGE